MATSEREKARKKAVEALGIYGRPDIEELRMHLFRVASLLERGEPLPPKLRDFMVEALLAIGDGQDANHALGLKSRGRPWHKKNTPKPLLNSEQRAMRNFRIYLDVEKLRGDGDASLDDVCLLLSGSESNTYPLEWETIKAIYKKERRAIADAIVRREQERADYAIYLIRETAKEVWREGGNREELDRRIDQALESVGLLGEKDNKKGSI